MRNDPAHCGGCANACKGGESCVDGKCALVCAGGTTACGAACRDLLIDPNNCGACGKICPPVAKGTLACVAGTCAAGCAPGFADCDRDPGNGCETPSTGACTCTSAVFAPSTKTCDPIAATEFGGGRGVPGDPFLVCSLAQLARVGAHLDGHFELRADLSFPDGTLHTPIGGGGAPEFTGVFDGLGHAISAARITPPAGAAVAGFFGRFGACAVVRDLRLLDARIDCPSCKGDVGLLAGAHAGRAERVRVTGILKADAAERVGGLFGSSTGTTLRTAAQVTVDGATSVGGLIGVLQGSLTECAAFGPVTGSSEVGGLVGRLRGSILRAYARGAVTGRADAAGGLVGVLDGGAISDALASGAVAGPKRVAGFVGLAIPSGATPATIDRAFSASTAVSLGGANGPAFLGEGAVTLTASYWFTRGVVAPQTLAGLQPVGTAPAAGEDPKSYPGFDFPAVWRITASDTESPWKLSLPALAWRCDGKAVVCL